MHSTPTHLDGEGGYAIPEVGAAGSHTGQLERAERVDLHTSHRVTGKI